MKPLYCGEWFLKSPFQNVSFISFHIACNIHLHVVLTQSTQRILQVNGKNKLNLSEKIRIDEIWEMLGTSLSGPLSSVIVMKYTHIWSSTLCLMSVIFGFSAQVENVILCV
jgi:hypothetical protein